MLPQQSSHFRSETALDAFKPFYFFGGVFGDLVLAQTCTVFGFEGALCALEPANSFRGSVHRHFVFVQVTTQYGLVGAFIATQPRCSLGGHVLAHDVLR
jgi:hypothetical protein